MKKLIISIITIGLYVSTMAQQTPLYSDYYYNPVLLNPAQAGYVNKFELNLSTFGLFDNFQGAPRTSSATANFLTAKNKLGLAIGVLDDEIGVTNTTNVFASYAYKIYFKYNSRKAQWWDYNPEVLSFGLSTSALFIREDLLSLNINDDPNFQRNINTTVPSFAAGVLFNDTNLFIGASIQNLLAESFADDALVSIESPIFLYGGYRFYTTKFKSLRIQPSILAKFVSGAPAQIDINTSINYKNKIEVGAGYRTSQSFNALIGFYISPKFRIAYNYTAYNNVPFSNTSGFIISYRTGQTFGN